MKVVDTESREQTTMNKIIKQIMREKNLAQYDMQQLLEMRSQSGVSQALRRDMKISTALRFLNVLGCKLIVEYDDRQYEVTE